MSILPNFKILRCTEMGKQVHFGAECRAAKNTDRKMIQIVQNQISYKKLRGRISLSPAEVKLGMTYFPIRGICQFWIIVTTFRFFTSLLMRVSGISINMFSIILLELWKYFEKNMERFWIYFAEINFRMRKILRKFYAKVEEIYG